MLCNLEEKHKSETHPKYSKDHLLTQTPPVCKASCISEELQLILGSLRQRDPPKSYWTNNLFTELLQNLYILLVWCREKGD